MNSYLKPPLSLDEQLALLAERGLLIDDDARARHYLANISYFRLSAYTRPFYIPDQDEHHFIDGTRFEQVLARKRLYFLLVIIESLLTRVSPDSAWSSRLVTLLAKYPHISLAHMGMPRNWQQDPFWQ